MGASSCSMPGGSRPFPASPSCYWCWPSTSRARVFATRSIRKSMTEALLQIRDLRTCFPTSAGLVVAVDGVSLDVDEGECLGVVGESGSGKSVTFASVIGLVRKPGFIAGGSIRFAGRELVGLPLPELRRLRGREIAMTMQDALTALNPALTIAEQITETVLAHDRVSPAEARACALEMLTLVGIPAAARRMGD